MPKSFNSLAVCPEVYRYAATASSGAAPDFEV